MTMGWHTVMEFRPSLVGCIIAGGNTSFEMIRKSRECVLNVPTTDLIDAVIGIGNCSGDEVDKFTRFHLTHEPAEMVSAPLIRECFANLECRLHDTRLVNSYNFFIFEVVKAHRATSPKYPKTLHYRGQGTFITSGEVVQKRSKFTWLKDDPNFSEVARPCKIQFRRKWGLRSATWQ